jgi:hypothetical protein
MHEFSLLAEDGVALRLSGMDLIYARLGPDLINCGALVEGLRVWAKVEPWGPKEIGLVARTTDPDRLLNAVAEQRQRSGRWRRKAPARTSVDRGGTAAQRWSGKTKVRR